MAQNTQASTTSSLANAFKAESTRRQALTIGGMGLGALLMAACGAGSSGSPSPAQSGGKPKKGGTLRLAIGDASSSDSLDPSHPISASTVIVTGAVFDQLVTLDPDWKAQPALATSWSANPDATRWTIRLREGVKWHDGSAFTSKDVLHSISRWLDPKVGSQVTAFLAPYLAKSGVSAPDDSTVVLSLKQPNSVLMQTLANLPGSVITKAGVTDFTLKTITGTGPFKLTEWTPGGSWKVVRNDAYWGGAPYLDGIQVTITPDSGAKLQAALSGSTDLTDPIPISLWAGLKGRDGVVLETVPNRNSWIFAFDQQKAPFNDPRVLEAIKLATDRDKLVQTALLGHGTAIADVPLNPKTSWYPKGLTPEFDMGRAKTLLADAGFPDGLDIKLSVSDAVPGMVDVAQVWQQLVKEAGIKVTLNQLPADTYWTKGWMASPAFMDYWTDFFPTVGFDAFYGKDASWNETGFDDPKLNSIVDELLSSTNASKQIELTQQAYLQARKTFGYLIPVISDAAYARAPRVNGVVMTVGSFDFRKAWLA
ncbi:ABC transporter substrate-binding protein [Streptomyces sp. NPDC047042]|uniref:ABC transporter substrate-binding protein n=1 Tax=Streptomyces sp. NPDC047042 TaxID=3154807 RepID=UPI003411D640